MAPLIQFSLLLPLQFRIFGIPTYTESGKGSCDISKHRKGIEG